MNSFTLAQRPQLKRARQAAMAKLDPPIGYWALRDLFEHLDRKTMAGYTCPHTIALSEAFLRRRGVIVGIDR